MQKTATNTDNKELDNPEKSLFSWFHFEEVQLCKLIVVLIGLQGRNKLCLILNEHTNKVSV